MRPSPDPDDRTSVYTALDGSRPAVPRSQVASLIVLRARSQAAVGMMIRLDQPETILGRSQGATVQVEDDGVSRSHAKVTASPHGGFQLMDMGSTNGTFLNDVKVVAAALHDGDKIQIGTNTVIKFSLQDPLDEAYQKSLYESATRDGLTSLFNKTYFMEALRKEFAYCQRHRAPLSILMIDVDHFKRINDTYGHAAGDVVLQHIAARIKDAVRAEDLLARYGGEEFTLLLRGAVADVARRCAERCRGAVAGAACTFQGQVIRTTVSIGVSTLADADCASPDDLVAVADACMYRAKESGRNRVEACSLAGA